MGWYKRFFGKSFVMAGVLVVSLGAQADDFTFQDRWLQNGNDIQNTRNAPFERKIGPENVGNLFVKWEYLTLPETGGNSAPMGSVAVTPAVDGQFVYFTDWTGNITKLDRETGALVWKKNFLNDISAPGYMMNFSTNTPAIVGDILVIGNNYLVDAPLCEVSGATPTPLGCHQGNGAIVVGLDKNDGSVKWRVKVDDHPSSKVTGSITAVEPILYVPVGGWEEEWARTYPNIYKKPIDPNSSYPCCSGRGSVVALLMQKDGPPKQLWKTYMAIGNDANRELKGSARKVLGAEGYWGVSAYGHAPTVDLRRGLIYVGTTNSRTAPKLVQLCEKARRITGDPNANIPNAQAGITDKLPDGLTCNNVNENLKTYVGSIVALDMFTGQVKWVNAARKYDAWVHSCGEGAFDGLGSVAIGIVYPSPLGNIQTCNMDPIGADYGFGSNPMFISNLFKPSEDILVVGNKDGRVFGIDPNTGANKWVTRVDPGSIYGGIQFGMATDGETAFAETSNIHNTNRDINLPFVGSQDFIRANALDTLLGLRAGLDHRNDNGQVVVSQKPGPGPYLPFIGPKDALDFLGLNSFGYPSNMVFPYYYNGVIPVPGIFTPYITGPASGPKELWTLVNPPSDVVVDGKNVVNDNGVLKTISGMLTAIDVKTGAIKWQRPLNDGLKGNLGPAGAMGNPTVANGVVYAGLNDTRGTILALDANTGVKLFEYHQTVTNASNEKIEVGSNEGGPAIVNGSLYWGMGAGTVGAFPADTALNFTHTGNRIIALEPCASGLVPSADKHSCVNP